MTSNQTVYPTMMVEVASGKMTEMCFSHCEQEEVYSEYGYFFLRLPPIEVEVPLLSPEEIRVRGLALLRKNREKLKAEHQAQLTKLQYLENQLLGLPSPEIVGEERRRYDDVSASDVEVKPARPADEDDDIPF